VYRYIQLCKIQNSFHTVFKGRKQKTAIWYSFETRQWINFLSIRQLPYYWGTKEYLATLVELFVYLTLMQIQLMYMPTCPRARFALFHWLFVVRRLAWHCVTLRNDATWHKAPHRMRFERTLTLPAAFDVIIFRVNRRRREMYCGHARLCVCLSVCLSVRGRMPMLLHGPGCNLGSGRGCPLVVHYWADLQSEHGLRCYDNITRTQNVSAYTCLYSIYA